MGYEAPWSLKIGTKKSLAYIMNEDELDEFWIAYTRYITPKKGAKKGTAAIEEVAGIVFRNMFDSAQVSATPLDGQTITDTRF